MPYMIRPRQDERLNFSRDGVGKDRPMRYICARWFTLFDELPPGADATGDAYQEVIKVESREDAEARALALGFELRDDVVVDDAARPEVKPSASVPVSEYLRDHPRPEKDADPLAAIDAINASLEPAPSGARFGRVEEGEEGEEEAPVEPVKRGRGRPRKVR